MSDQPLDWRAEVRARLHDAEPDVVEELAQHLEDQFAELRAGGRSEADARDTLRAHLADPSAHDRIMKRRRIRDSDPIGREPTAGDTIASMWQDVRYGWRSLRRSPAFTIVAVLSLALGIGATTAIFGLLHAVLLERLAVRHPEELVQLQRSTGKGLFDRFGYTHYLVLKRSPGLPRIEATASSGVTIVAGNERDYPNADLVSGGFFEMLGVRPLAGRTITAADEDSRAPVVVVSQDFWEQHLAGDAAAVGRTITIDDHPFTVIGVLPRSYHGLVFGGAFTLAVPLSVTALVGLPELTAANRPTLVGMFARLSPGQQASAGGSALDVVYQQCCAVLPLPGPPGGIKGSSAGGGARTHIVALDASRGATSAKVDLRAQYQQILMALMAGVVVLLLIACANVGNLLLARAAARQRELSVRMSMGATRSRIVRQLLIESLELAVSGALLGLLFARFGTTLLAHNLPPIAGNLADAVVLPLHGVILGFAAATTLGCTLLFGVLPALRATRVDSMTPLKDGARAAGGTARSLVDRGIVVAQMALALVLVCAAALFVRTLRNLKQFDGASAASHVLLAQVDTRGTTYEARGMTAIYPDLLERARHLPGVTNASMSTTVPVFGGMRSRDFIRVPGFERRDDDDFSASFAAVTPDFFATTGIGIERGRVFDARDLESAEPVAIVSRAFADHFFTGRDPMGGKILLGESPDAPQLRVVGVARDARYDDLRAPPPQIFYAPVAQAGNNPYLVLSLQTTGDAIALGPALRRTIEAVAPGIRVRRLAGFEQALNDALARERLAAALATLFGALALALAAVGLYGVVAYNVNRRTHEIGVRMALGARRADVLWLVVRQTLTMTGVGVALGVPLALGAAHGIGAQLYGVGANDPRAFVGAALVLIAAGTVASVVPARRAAQVDPVEALRAE